MKDLCNFIEPNDIICDQWSTAMRHTPCRNHAINVFCNKSYCHEFTTGDWPMKVHYRGGVISNCLCGNICTQIGGKTYWVTLTKSRNG